MKKSLLFAVALAAVACLALSTGASAAENGEPGGSAAPSGAAPGAGYLLTYDNFSGTCDTAGFTSSATGHALLETDVVVDGRGRLNGAAHSTYGFPLSGGDYSYPTGFSRVYAPAEPDATWQYVFYSRLLAEGDQGTSITTITCTNGVFTASNRFDATSTQEIPTLSQLGLVALALLLGAGAIFALRRRTA